MNRGGISGSESENGKKDPRYSTENLPTYTTYLSTASSARQCVSVLSKLPLRSMHDLVYT